MGDPAAIDVGLGSTRSPCDDVLDDCAASDCDAEAEVVVDVELDLTSVDDWGAAEELCAFDEAGGGCALVFSGAFALETALDAALAILGHRDVTPTSSLKTPMMLASPRSTSLHTLFTTSPIFFNPATHASVHCAEPCGSKSLALQPSMFVVYAARHCALSILMSWKFASWTADAVLRRAKVNIVARSEAYIVRW